MPDEQLYDILVTINGDWIAVPSDWEDRTLGWMAGGATAADVQRFRANENNARAFVLEEAEESWSIILPTKE